MSQVVIKIDSLGKKYRIAHQLNQSSQYKSMREVLAGKLSGLVKRAASSGRMQARTAKPCHSSKEDFWALRDLSLEVKQGEVLGIIGRNGAGKSTLLKVLSRITEPTEGCVALRGRVASLLEVATGFHPELTGRENIFLNGAIMGMTRAEIKSKFDEIVDFAEVERFLDTPVKRYSSGMYVRLAFSVAAHLEPEILIVDEVLAVGDVQFQRKCLGKMHDVASAEGRTVLLVSHNFPAILRLCGLACWLEKGHLMEVGRPQEVIASYLRFATTSLSEWIRPHSTLNEKPAITRVAVSSVNQCSSGVFTVGDPVTILITIASQVVVRGCQVHVRVSTEDGTPLFTTTSSDSSLALTTVEDGTTQWQVVIPSDFLSPGSYSLICAILVPGGELIDVVADKVRFEIHPGLNHVTFFPGERIGLVTPLLEWTGTHQPRQFLGEEPN